MKLSGLDRKKAGKWMWALLAALVALQVYFVRELLAALLLFTVVFVIFALVALTADLVDRAGQRSFERTGAWFGSVTRFTRRKWHLVEEISKKQLRRLRSEPVR